MVLNSSCLSWEICRSSSQLPTAAIWRFPECRLEKAKGWKVDQRAFELSVMEVPKSWLLKWPGNWPSE
jgi:hypothetical protein